MTTIINDPKVWSYSRFNAFVTCPLMFKFKYIDRIKPPTDDWLVFGSFVDKAFRNLAMMYPNQLLQEELDSLFDTVMKEQQEKYGECPRMDKPSCVKLCYKFCEILFAEIECESVPRPDPVPSELEVAKIPGTDDHFIQGFLDGESIEKNTILEYKTAAKAWSESKAADHDQPDVYAWMKKTRPKSLTLVFNKTTTNLQRITKEYSDDRVEWILERYSRIARLFDVMRYTNLWYPTKNFLCGFCFYRKDCQKCQWGKDEFESISNKVDIPIESTLNPDQPTSSSGRKCSLP